MLIGFTCKTSKIMPRLFCKHFRHCAIFLQNNADEFTMLQTGISKINLIPLKKRDLQILKQHGWVFIKTNKTIPLPIYPQLFTCVSFAKHILGIHAFFILTPDALYKYLMMNN